MTQAYWNACYSAEIVYPSSFGAVDHVDPDSDGDGVRDGADDQDRDDVPNVMELSRNAASGYWDAMGSCTPLEGLPEPPATHHNEAFGWVQPFDPCSPTPDSRTCSRHPGFDKIPSAFNASVLHWVSLN
jgi:hypothetical protein